VLSQPDEMPDRLAVMIAKQRELQERYMLNGNSFTDMTTLDRVRYVKDMVQAAGKELYEALDEVTWKPWDHSQPQIHEEHLFVELVDTWHFIMNLLIVTYPADTPESLARRFYVAYLRKREINVDRQERGYDNDLKCPICGRALDDVGFSASEDPNSDVAVVLCHGCHGTFAQRLPDAA